MRKNLMVLAVAAALPAQAAPTAVFPPVFINSSPEPTSPQETARLKTMEAALTRALADSGQYQPIDLAPIAAEVLNVRDIHDCNGCEAELARKAGAKYAVVAWTQKVSNLILNLNVRIEDAETGQVLRAGSADIRGNTDESWNRGLKYLLKEYVLRTKP